MTRYDRARVRGLHQHQDFTFHAPIPAGAELVFTGRLIEKFTKRGKGYFRHQGEARDRGGRLLISEINTEIIDMSRPGVADDPDTRKARRLTATWDAAAPVSVSVAGAEAGMRLEEGTIDVDRAQAAVFSGLGDEFVNIHTSRAIALEMGFADAVVQGLMNVCWLSECLTRWAGVAWLCSGTMAASFLRPRLVGQQAAVRTAIVRSGAEGIELESSFVNAAGETQVVALSTLKA
jgi:hypothetical protein